MVASTEDTQNYLYLNAPKLYELAVDTYIKIEENSQPFELLHERHFYKEVIICIIFSFMSFEGFINELPLLIEYYYKKGEEKEKFAEKIIFCLKEFENSKVSINSRLLTIHQLIFEKGYEKDKQVYQNFNDLLVLRNEITHLKAKDKFSIDKDGTIDNKILPIINRLTSARIIDDNYKYKNDNFEKEVPLPFIELISQKNVAKWACNTIFDTIDELVKSMPESEIKTYIDAYFRNYWKKV